MSTFAVTIEGVVEHAGQDATNVNLFERERAIADMLRYCLRNLMDNEELTTATFEAPTVGVVDLLTDVQVQLGLQTVPE